MGLNAHSHTLIVVVDAEYVDDDLKRRSMFQMLEMAFDNVEEVKLHLDDTLGISNEGYKITTLRGFAYNINTQIEGWETFSNEYVIPIYIFEPFDALGIV